MIHHALWQIKRISTEKKAGNRAYCLSRSPGIHANLFPEAPQGCVGSPKEQSGGDGLPGVPLLCWKAFFCYKKSFGRMTMGNNSVRYT